MSSSSAVTIEAASVASTKRQRRSIEERRRIVEETLAPGTSVARVARAHGVNANQVFGWRRLYQRGLLGGRPAAATALLPVTVRDSLPAVAPAKEPIQPRRSEHPVVQPARAGVIEIELAKGRLRIEGAADPEALRLVLESLLG